MNKEYDIFISYKERDGARHAAFLKENLADLGYKLVYFNPPEKRQGNYEERLESAIKSCTDFILVLTPLVVDAVLNKNYGGKKAMGEETDGEYNADFDYVLWELSKAWEYKKHVVIVNTGSCGFDSVCEFKYNEEIEKLKIVCDYDEISSIHKAENFPLYCGELFNKKVLENLYTDIAPRWMLRKIIYNVLSSRYKVRHKNGISLSERYCTLNLPTLAALCDCITNDNSIATELDNCADVGSLEKYLEETGHLILHDFSKWFGFGTDVDNNIYFTLKRDVSYKNLQMPMPQVLEALFKSYCKKGDNFHSRVNDKKKKLLDITVSRYILSMAWQGYFIKNKDYRGKVIDEIIPGLIKFHNHSQDYIFALLQSREFSRKKEWLFCDYNDDNESVYSKKVIAVIGNFYADVAATDMSRCNFGRAVFRWLDNEPSEIYKFCCEMLTTYNCRDAYIWNYFVCQRQYSSDILPGIFRGLVADKNYKAVIKMIEYGLRTSVYYRGDEEIDDRMFKLITDTFQKIISGRLDESEVGKTYYPGILMALSTFYHKGDLYRLRIKEFVDKAYLTHKIPEFKDIYMEVNNIFEDVDSKESYSSKNIEKILAEMLQYSDESLVANNKFSYRVNKLKVTEGNAELCNKVYERLLYLCKNYSFYGIGAVLYIPFGNKLLSKSIQEKACDLIKKVVKNEVAEQILTYPQFNRLMKLFEFSEFSDLKADIPGFKVNTFKNIFRIQIEHPKDRFLLLDRLLDDDVIDIIISKLCADEKDVLCMEVLGKFFNKGLNEMKGFDWRRACMYPLIIRLVEGDTFRKIDFKVQKSVLFYTMHKDEYFDKVAELTKEAVASKEIWESYHDHVKIAFITGIDRFVDDFNEFSCVTDFADKVIDDLASCNYEHYRIYEKYGRKEETLISIFLSLYKSTPEKTARLSVYSIVKFYTQLYNYTVNKEKICNMEILCHRLSDFCNVAANPCIRGFVKLYAELYIEVIIKLNELYDLVKNFKGDILGMLEGIVKNDEFPKWFGKDASEYVVKWVDSFKENKFRDISKIRKTDKFEKILACPFENVENDLSKFEVRKDEEFEFYDGVLNDALTKYKMSGKVVPVEFKEERERILLWKNSVDDKRLYALTKRMMFFRFHKNPDKYKGFKFNGIVYTPSITKPIPFEKKVVEKSDVSALFERLGEEIEKKYGEYLINDNYVGKRCGKYSPTGMRKLNVKKSDTIHEFYRARAYFYRMIKKYPVIGEAFSGFLKEVSKTLKVGLK